MPIYKIYSVLNSMRKPRVFIFASDEPLGYEICYYLLKSDKFKDEIDTVYAGILNNDKRYDLEKIGAIVVRYSENNLSNAREYLIKCEASVLIVHSTDKAFLTASLMMKLSNEVYIPYPILISQFNSDKSPPLSSLRKFLLLEASLNNYNLNGAILKCGLLTDNLLYTATKVRNENKLKLCLGEAKVSLISKKDVSYAVSCHLVNHFKKNNNYASNHETFVLTGSQQCDGNGIAKTISKVTNQYIEYEDIEREEMGKLLDDQGLSYRHNEYILDLLGIAKAGHFEFITDDFEKLTGEKPSRVKKFIKDNDLKFKPDLFCNII